MAHASHRRRKPKKSWEELDKKRKRSMREHRKEKDVNVINLRDSVSRGRNHTDSPGGL